MLDNNRGPFDWTKPVTATTDGLIFLWRYCFVRLWIVFTIRTVMSIWYLTAIAAISCIVLFVPQTELVIQSYLEDFLNGGLFDSFGSAYLLLWVLPAIVIFGYALMATARMTLTIRSLTFLRRYPPLSPVDNPAAPPSFYAKDHQAYLHYANHVLDSQLPEEARRYLLHRWLERRHALRSKRVLRYVLAWLPRILAIIPLLALGARMPVLAAEVGKLGLGWTLAMGVWTAAGLLIWHFVKPPPPLKKVDPSAPLDPRRTSLQRFSARKYGVAPEALRFSPITFREAFAAQPVIRKWLTRIAALAIFFMLFLSYDRVLNFPNGLPLSVNMGSLAIVYTALIFYTLLTLPAHYLDYKFRFPVSLIGFFVLFVWGFSNNNHIVRTTSQVPTVAEGNPMLSPSADRRPELRPYLKERARLFLAQAEADGNTTGAVPVIIVSGMGGGIRAGAFTEQCLEKMDAMPYFRDHLLALSTVSGSSVGAGVYVAGFHADRKKRAEAAEHMLTRDFLSPLFAAMLSVDFWQEFLPFILPSWDRSRFFEDALSNGWASEQDSLGSPTLGWDKGFLSFFDPSKKFRPLLFLNSTRVETGEKAVTSPLRLDGNPSFDVIDVLGRLGADIPYSTALHNSARFPYFSPGGVVQRNGSSGVDCGKLFTLVDGGYADNSGLATAMGLAQEIYALGQRDENKPEAQQDYLRFRRLVPVIIYLKNGFFEIPRYGTERDFNDRPDEVLLKQDELLTPPLAFLNQWDNGDQARIPEVRQRLRNMVISRNITDSLLRKDPFFVMAQDIPEGEKLTPLGWTLSKAAWDTLHARLESQFLKAQRFPYVTSYGNQKVNNASAFQSLQNLLAAAHRPNSATAAVKRPEKNGNVKTEAKKIKPAPAQTR
jgi:hypothetical protein